MPRSWLLPAAIRSLSAVGIHRSNFPIGSHATVLANSSRDPIVICWHPPKPFPYEHSKPIERTEEELRQGASPVRSDLMMQFKTDRARASPKPRPFHELQNMFYTYYKSFEKKPTQKRIKETCEPRPINRKGL